MSSNERPLSLLGRLLIAATIWCMLAVAITSWVLIGLFKDHLEREAERELHDQVVELVSLTRIDRTGSLRLAGRLPDARFQRPFSGWAWQIRRGDSVLAQAPSLGPLGGGVAALAAPAGAVGRFAGSDGRELRGLARTVAPRFSSQRLTFAVARPEDEITRAVGAYRRSVLIALFVLGAGLVATVVAAFWIGLRPLRRLRAQIALMRRGEQPPQRDWPREIAPIAAELDQLKVQTERLVGRAKGLAADLAHAIKTPLSVIRQHAEGLETADRQVLRRQADRIGLSLERHLSQSSAGGAPYRRVALKPCVEDLIFALRRAQPERELLIETEIPESAGFLGDEADLYEILGNPLENAGHWARSWVGVTSEAAGGRLRISIEDDGPGIPQSAQLAMLERGRRLDEATPGHGLGLAILRDLVELYGGTLSLGEASRGGLRVTFDLPGS